MRLNSFICGLLLSLTLSLPVYAQSDEGKIAFWFQKVAAQQGASPPITGSSPETTKPTKAQPSLRDWISQEDMIANPDLVVSVSIHLTRRGEITGTPEVTGSGGDPIVLKRAMDGARRAVIAAAPYEFPPDKYDTWKDVYFTFHADTPGEVPN